MTYNRMSMAQPLVSVFINNGTEVTAANAPVLCAIACELCDVFYALVPARERTSAKWMVWHMSHDVTQTYCYVTPGVKYTPYENMLRNTLRAYSPEQFKDAEFIRAVFDATTAKIAQIRKVLADDGFSDFTY